MANEVAKREESAVAEYGSGVNFSELLAEELDGLTPTFERIKIPAGGGLAYEVPGDAPEDRRKGLQAEAQNLSSP